MHSRVGRLVHKARSAHEGLAQPVPYAGGAPDYPRLHKRAACGILCFAVLDSLHGAFICAYLEISNLT